MVIEHYPALHDLSVEDKILLSEELCMDLLLDAKTNPTLAKTIQQRLEAFRTESDAGVSWDELKQRLSDKIAK
ncbi:MAG: hypothetical protein KDK97_06775 [Verrucomicrobiales bacterium]|nr:hypothetical protein [Verrucomicrobiales bacterium]MCP5558124.1 hypothetical protein [Verrucomicrobiaceae bacterium]